MQLSADVSFSNSRPTRAPVCSRPIPGRGNPTLTLISTPRFRDVVARLVHLHPQAGPKALPTIWTASSKVALVSGPSSSEPAF